MTAPAETNDEQEYCELADDPDKATDSIYVNDCHEATGSSTSIHSSVSFYYRGNHF